jgi:large subunit ribosomal protein L22
VEVRARLRFVRGSPRKVRAVAQHLRGKPVEEALHFLRLTPQAAGRVLMKLLRSALSNAEDKGTKDEVESLRVSRLDVDGGPSLKRFLPRARGRATPIRKRTSHITVILRSPEEE